MAITSCCPSSTTGLRFKLITKYIWFCSLLAPINGFLPSPSMSTTKSQRRSNLSFKMTFRRKLHPISIATSSKIDNNGEEGHIHKNTNDENNEQRVLTTTPAILYESENVLAINKPPHIPHHNSDQEIGIMSHIRSLQQKQRFPYHGRLYGVHRLDRCTSGILLFAKNKETAISLSNAFRDKQVTKYYLALTGKKPKKKKQGWVKGGMVPSRRGTWKLTNSDSKNTCNSMKKEKRNQAVTRFYSAGLGSCNPNSFHRDLVVISNNNNDNDDHELRSKTMVLFEPHTGKTHQLRVAAKSLGLPILGDKMYDDAVHAETFERTYLHALAIDVIVHTNHDDSGGEHITIYNPPNWFHNGQGKSSDAESVLELLLKKHCQNESIRNYVSRYYDSMKSK